VSRYVTRKIKFAIYLAGFLPLFFSAIYKIPPIFLQGKGYPEILLLEIQ